MTARGTPLLPLPPSPLCTRGQKIGDSLGEMINCSCASVLSSLIQFVLCLCLRRFFVLFYYACLPARLPFSRTLRRFFFIVLEKWIIMRVSARSALWAEERFFFFRFLSFFGGMVWFLFLLFLFPACASGYMMRLSFRCCCWYAQELVVWTTGCLPRFRPVAHFCSLN